MHTALLCTLSVILLALPRVAPLFQDAFGYKDPASLSVMECSDRLLQRMADLVGGESLYVRLARSCCEDVAYALYESNEDAEDAAEMCFSRTLFPRPLRSIVADLRRCVLDVLAEDDDEA